MKFGKELRTHLEETLPEWRDKFLCYKPLKKLLKNLPSTVDSFSSYANRGDDRNSNVPHNNASRPPSLDLQDWFVRILNEELEKFNDFYIDKEEEFIIRFQELKERIEQIREKMMDKDVEFTSDTEFSEELMEIRKDFVTIHGEMVLLKNYSSLNFAGLVKILKKYDKRTGGLLQLPFTQLALHQPFFTTEPLTRLVHESEANLELLFPSEAEVVESSLARQAGLLERQPIGTSEDMPLETQTLTTLGEEAGDIYRSTLAAMRTIKGLQKASSTYNPLSISYFYSMKDEESTSGVTDENPSSNSPSMSQIREDVDRTESDG